MATQEELNILLSTYNELDRAMKAIETILPRGFITAQRVERSTSKDTSAHQRRDSPGPRIGSEGNGEVAAGVQQSDLDAFWRVSETAHQALENWDAMLIRLGGKSKKDLENGRGPAPTDKTSGDTSRPVAENEPETIMMSDQVGQQSSQVHTTAPEADEGVPMAAEAQQGDKPDSGKPGAAEPDPTNSLPAVGPGASNSGTESHKNMGTGESEPLPVQCLSSDLYQRMSGTMAKLFTDNAAAVERGFILVQVTGMRTGDAWHEDLVPPHHDTYQGVKYEHGKSGFANVVYMPSEHADMPGFEAPVTTTLSRAEMENIFEFLATKPQNGIQPYYVGPSLIRDKGPAPILDAGPALRDGLETVAGVNTVFHYVSAAGNQGFTSTVLHKEDCEWPSANVVLTGQGKVWLVARPDDRDKLERKMKEHFQYEPECSQHVRHRSVIVAPSILRGWGIRFSCVFQLPGELIITAPAAYHQVVNLGDNLAESVNFTTHEKWEPNERLYPYGYTFCAAETCGTENSITEATFTRGEDEEEDEEDEIEEVEEDEAEDENEEDENEPAQKKRRLNPGQPSTSLKASKSSQPGLSLTPARLVSALTGKDATQRFIDLVHAVRHSEKTVDLLRYGGFESEKGLQEVLSREAGDDLLDKMLKLICRLRLAQARDEKLEKERRKRLRKGEKTLSRRLAMDLFRGNKLLTMFRDHEGLLCWLPFAAGKNQVSATQTNLDGLKAADARRIHDMINKKQDLLQGPSRLGKALIAIIEGKTSGEFAFEFLSQPTKRRLIGMDPTHATSLVSLIEYPQHIKIAYLGSGDDEWPRPASWPDELEWPQQALDIPNQNQDACDICTDDKPCHGIEEYNRRGDTKTRIVHREGRGAGVQAIGRVKGGIVFRAGDPIREVVGTLHPGEQDEGVPRQLKVERTDFGGSISVGTLRFEDADTGNWTRLVGHSCSPNSRMSTLTIHGKVAVLLEACRDILDLQEITIDWSMTYGTVVDKEACLCVDCSGRRWYEAE